MIRHLWNRISDGEKEICLKFTSESPVKIATLARELGVDVFVSTMSPGISGEIKRNSDTDRFEIRVNRHENKRRQRFTIAHEVAHYLLHRDVIGDGIQDDILYRSSLSDLREAEANKFAAELIMPKKLVVAAKNARSDLNSSELISELSELFNVSPQAMSIRLGL